MDDASRDEDAGEDKDEKGDHQQRQPKSRRPRSRLLACRACVRFVRPVDEMRRRKSNRSICPAIR